MDIQKIIDNILRKKKSRKYLKQKYTKEEMIFLLQKLAKEVHGIPTITDLKYCVYTPTSATYLTYFGSWKNALREAGLLKE